MPDVSKRLIKLDDRPFHTSGYAQVANGSRVGAVSTMSFERRQQIDQNRQRVGGYQRSAIGMSGNYQKPKPAVTNTASSQVHNSPTEQPMGRYDPYA
jgi:hypothetical protein